MKNIAISFSGQPYSHEDCFFSFKQNVSIKNCNKFSHFWWSKEYHNKCYKLHYSLKCDQLQPTHNLYKQFDINTFKEEPHKNYDLSFIRKFNLNTWESMNLDTLRFMVPIFMYGYMSQTDSVFASTKMVSDCYDIIIKTRPDLVYTKNIETVLNNLNIQEDTIYFQSSMDGGHLYAGEFANKPCDWFYTGTTKTIKRFTELMFTSLLEYFKDGIIHMRDYIQQICNNNNLNIKLIDFGAVIHKQTNNFNYQKHHIPFEFYVNDFDKTTLKPKTPSAWPYWIKNIDFEHFKEMI